MARLFSSRYRSLLLGALLTTVSIQCLAWNQMGHHVVAAIAYDHLTPQSKMEVNQWLSHHPDYQRWIKDASPADRAEIAFIEAASWPDEIKGRADFENDGEMPKGPESAQNIGFSDHLMHKYWHYVDYGLSLDGTPVQSPYFVNAVTQIRVLHQALSRSQSSIELKAYDLPWLIHIVADVHQPLHAVSRFTKDEPAGDAGGNRVKLCEHPCRENLHSFWDDALGHGKDDEKAVREALRLERRSAEQLGGSDPEKWAMESFEIAKHYAYDSTSIAALTTDISHPTEEYRRKVHEIAREQAVKAGLRLAAMINQEVSDSTHH